jgi:hypothetical protein
MLAYTMFRYERDSATATDDGDDAGQPGLHTGVVAAVISTPLDWMTYPD